MASIRLKNLFSQDGDWVDWLCGTFTVFLLVVLAAMASYKYQQPATAISCWGPAHFTSSMIGYTNKYCWFNKEYYLPIAALDPRLVPSVPKREKGEYAYYHWVPLVFVMQAFLFAAPSLFWIMMKNRTPANLDNLLRTAELATEMSRNQNGRMGLIKGMTLHIDSFMAKPGAPLAVRNFLVPLSLFVKFLNLVTAVVQVCLINTFIGNPSWGKFVEFLNPGRTGIRFGNFLNYIGILKENETLDLPQIFPKVILCDFPVRVFGNIHRHTVQCNMDFNYLFEKIYIFLWYWLMVLVLVTTLNILYKLLSFPGLSCMKHRFVKQNLQMVGKWDGNYSKLHQFSSMYLRQDGVFILKHIARRADTMVTAQIIGQMWEKFQFSICQQVFQKVDNLEYRKDCLPLCSQSVPLGAGHGLPVYVTSSSRAGGEKAGPSAPEQCRLYPNIMCDDRNNETE